MSSNNAKDRKRKPTTMPDTVSSKKESKKIRIRRVSTRASTSDAASLQVDTPAVTEKANTSSTTSSTTVNHEESIQTIGKMIQDLFCSDNAKVNATLDALHLDNEDIKKCESLVTAGGCLALVQVLKNCLDKAIASIPACDQVTELNELAELTTLYNTLGVVINLTFQHVESRAGISAIGGLEAVVKVMKTFPKCQALQDYACQALRNLACNSVTGKANAIEAGGIEVILAAINNHLGSSFICRNACWALRNMVHDSKENTRLRISLGGGAAVYKVRNKWPDDESVQMQVQKLVDLIALEWKALASKK
jgi:hypothetical protein